MNTEVPTAEVILQRDPELFECYALVALNHSDQLWYDISPYLCVEKTNTREFFVNDFSNAAYYALYRALKFGRERLAESGSSFVVIPDSEILNALAILAQDPISPVLAPEKIIEFYQVWISINNKVDREFAILTIKSAWKVWLSRKKTQRALARVHALDGEGLDKALATVQKVNSDISSTGDSIVSISDLVGYEQPVIERLPLSDNPFKHLNEVLGGGFGRTEHSLFVAPSGGGKTVLACQLAADLAMNGRRVLLISTEQSATELLPRFISCISGAQAVAKKERIPFKQIKDNCNLKVLGDILSAAQYKTAMEILENLNGKLFIENWRPGRSVYDIQSSLDRVNRQLKSDKIDVVILDWIGKALAEQTVEQGKLRLLYSDAASAMKDLAIRNNIATISMAQATADSVGKAHIDNSCIAECHSLHNEATVAVGISAMKAKDASDADSTSSSYALHQCFYCFKARKSEAQKFMMRRNFGYQRFDNA